METDEFTPGQWLKGKIAFASLSPDGRHIAFEVMGGRTRIASWEDTQYVAVSCSPYFTALYFKRGGLCYTSALFTHDGKLAVDFNADNVWRAANACPYEIGTFDSRIFSREFRLNECSMNRPQDSWTTGNGRTIFAKDGQLFEQFNENSKLLFDANLYQPEKVQTPEWALLW